MKVKLRPKLNPKNLMKIRISFFAVFFLFSCTSLRDTYAFCNFPEHSPFPGGVINKILFIKSSLKPEIKAEGKGVYLCQVDKHLWRALIPINLFRDKNSIDVFHNENLILNIPIENKAYRESKITIDNQDMVSPPAEYLPRIKRETELSFKAINILTNTVLSSLKMSKPIEGLKSSEFGVRRFINNQPRNRHTGLDLAAPSGTEIRAPLSGKVVLIGNFYYRGNTVFLDHGGGLISTYSHLNDVLVQNQDLITKNQIIGKVGQTGRVTGPHLHWQTILSGIPVDPELFLEEPL